MNAEQKEGFAARKAALDAAMATCALAGAAQVIEAAELYHDFLLGYPKVEITVDAHGQLWAPSTELPDLLS